MSALIVEAGSKSCGQRTPQSSPTREHTTVQCVAGRFRQFNHSSARNARESISAAIVLRLSPAWAPSGLSVELACLRKVGLVRVAVVTRRRSVLVVGDGLVGSMWLNFSVCAMSVGRTFSLSIFIARRVGVNCVGTAFRRRAEFSRQSTTVGSAQLRLNFCPTPVRRVSSARTPWKARHLFAVLVGEHSHREVCREPSSILEVCLLKCSSVSLVV